MIKILIFAALVIGAAWLIFIKIPEIVGSGKKKSSSENSSDEGLLNKLTKEEQKAQAARQALLDEAEQKDAEATKTQAEADTVRKALQSSQ